MDISSRFSLEKHEGDYESWPGFSYLYDNGRKTKTKMPGYNLIHSFILRDGRFLISVDKDCPFEEEATAVLLSPELKVISTKSFPGSPLLNPNRFNMINQNEFEIFSYGPERYRVNILKRKTLFCLNYIQIKQTAPVQKYSLINNLKKFNQIIPLSALLLYLLFSLAMIILSFKLIFSLEHVFFAAITLVFFVICFSVLTAALYFKLNGKDKDIN